MSEINPTQEQIDGALTVLVLARIDPSRYFSNSKFAVNSFMSGFWAASALCGIYPTGEMEILIERGWKRTSFDPVLEMENEGLSEAEITVEILTIAILTLQRNYKVNSQVVYDIHRQIRSSNKQIEDELNHEVETGIFKVSNKINELRKKDIIFKTKLMAELERDLRV
ncbi:MAG: hypothetical protein GC179_28270 [Anaerolineaceae bacterium]|nr:hypothetical protein [Anaerolineaceae bacterium]